MHATLFRFLLLLGLLGVPNVSSAFLGIFDDDPDAEVRKVLIQYLNLSERVQTRDPMISFERKRRLYGAVEKDEYKEREGKYFIVFWRTEKPQRKPGMVVRLEYLGAATADEVHVVETTVDKVGAHNTTEISVIGEDFESIGDIIAWKVSLVRDGAIVADAKSFLWE